MIGRFVVALLALLAAFVPGAARAWPEHNVTVMVPFGAGSSPDIIARVLADGLQQRTGKTFIVENRVGASGNTATNAVAKASPDGHTLGVSILGPLVVNPMIMSTVPYDPQRDIAPLAIVSSMPSVLVVSNELKVDSVAGLIARLKADPGRYNYGSIGKGSLSHLAIEALAAASDTRLVHVVFPGSPDVARALIRGDVHLAALPAGTVVPLGREGKLRMLAVTLPQRTSLVPELPTMSESGIPEVEADSWVGLIAPAATPPELQAVIVAQTQTVMREPAAANRLAAVFMMPVAGTPEGFRAVLAAERARWEPVIRAGKIRAE